MQIIKKKKKKSSTPKKDPVKEGIYRALAAILAQAGIEVRREELKRGPGWQVMSGMCQVSKTPKVFVDRRMSQDDQINFLVDRIVAFALTPQEEQLADLPESLANQLRNATLAPTGS